MTPYGFIYVTTNLINGKRYIGQCALHRRNWKSYLGSGKALKRAILKYGSTKFTREILFYGFSKEDMNVIEEHFIVECNAVERTDFYNISPNAYTTRGFKGKKHSQETKTVISEYGKNRPATARMRESCALIGKLPKTALQLKASRQSATSMGRNNYRPKEHRTYVCVICNGEFNRTEYVHHPRKEAPLCSQKCVGVHSRLKRKNVRKIFMGGVVYDCIKDAAQALSVSYDVIYYRVKHSNSVDCGYVNDDS